MSEPDNSPPNTISGTAMVVGLFALALALALFAWFYAQTNDRRAMEAWGPEQAALIVSAPIAELWVLSADVIDTATEVDRLEISSLEVDGQSLTVVRRRDISAARGALHIRRGLIEDTSFAWDRAGDDNCEPEWTHVLSFADDDARVSLLVSLDCPRVRLVESGQELSFRPIAAVVREFVAEQTGEETTGE